MEKINISEEAKALPDMHGSGLVRDLREAASLDNNEGKALLAKLTQYNQLTSREDRLLMLDSLLDLWGATSSMLTSSYSDTLDQVDNITATVRSPIKLNKKIKILERFNGTQFLDYGNSDTPTPYWNKELERYVQSKKGALFSPVSLEQKGMLNDAYDELKESLYGTLAVQTNLKPYLNQIALLVDKNSGVATLDSNGIASVLERLMATNPKQALIDLVELNKYASKMLIPIGFDGLALLNSYLNKPAYIAAVSDVSSMFGLVKVNGVWNGSKKGEFAFSGDNDDSLSGYDGNDQLFSGAGNDRLYGGYGEDILVAGKGDDTLWGGEDNDILQGNEGNDVLVGERGDDTLDGGSGNDSLDGGLGNDTYLFGRGSGNDVINSLDKTTGKLDVIQLGVGVLTSDVILKRDGTALVLSIKGTNDSVRVFGYFFDDATYGNQVEQIKFADGMIWDVDAVKNIVLIASEGDDILTSYATGNTILGLAGNDTLYGSIGKDILDGGLGADNINGGYGDDTLIGGVGDDSLNGQGGNDLLLGNEDNDTLFGDLGDDILDGGAGNDSLDGGTGNDTYLFGRGSGNDVINSLDKTTGKLDVIQLGAGVLTSDVILKRDGTALVLSIKGTNDSVRVFGYFFDDATYGNQVEQIKFADGMIWDIAEVKRRVLIPIVESVALNAASKDVVLTRSNDSLMIAVSGKSDRIELKDYFYKDAIDNPAAKSLQLADGLVWDAEIVKQKVLEATAARDWLTGYATNDVINGGDGDDGLFGEGGDDILDGGNGADNVQGGEGNDIVKGGAGADTIYGGNGNDSLLGNDGDDSLYAEAGNDTLDGGAGNDLLKGGAGADTYLFGKGSGQDTVVNVDSDAVGVNADRILFAAGITTDDISLTRAADSLMIRIKGTNDSVEVKDYFYLDGHSNYGLDFLQFADGTIWDLAAVKVKTLIGDSGNNTLNGFATADIISGLAGDDYLYGKAGNDTLDGGDGADWLYGEEGDDSLKGGAGADKLYGGMGNDSYDVDNIADVITENAAEGTDLVQANVSWTLGNNLENLTLTGSAAINGTGNALNNVLIGNAGANTLTGAVGNDTLSGGAGADALIGGAGNDTYVLARGDGSDTVTENDATAKNTDVAQFQADIASDQLWFRKVSNHLEVSVIGTGDKLTMQNWYSGNAYHVEQFKTSDGKVLLDTQVDALVSAMAAFNPPAAGQLTLNQQQQDALQPVLVANWH
ncbi:MAG: hypothetical protein RL571_1067 [Pseudomonadota bacterium]|jgi:Ca2+-binding RTX toxin-like protein